MQTQTRLAANKRSRIKPLRNPDLPDCETTPDGLFYLYHWLGQIAERQALWEFTRSSGFSKNTDNLQFALYTSINRYNNVIDEAIKKIAADGYLPFAHVDTTMVAA
jgi:uncharacterized membrane protein